MASLRQLIASALVRILSDGKPRKARDLAPLVQRQLQRSDIDRLDVNSVLYRDLGSDMKCNASFEWQLAKSSCTSIQPPASAHQPEQEGSPDMLRTVQRLRSGLPPCEHV